MTNPELVFQLKDKRNQQLSSHLLLYLTLFIITLMGYVTIKKIWGGSQPGGLFSSRMQKSEIQTTLEAHTWNCEMHRPWEMGLGHPQTPNSLQRKDGSSPTLSTTAEKVGNLGDFYWSKTPFQICISAEPGRLLPASQESISSTPCPKTLCSPTHTQIPSR